MDRYTFARLAAALLCLPLACGDAGGDTDSGSDSDSDSDSDSGAVGDEDGQVSEPFAGYCVATFETETAVQDVFGDTLLTARPGERYLMSSYESDASAELLFLSAHGPVDFEVSSDGAGLPFSSNCAPGETADYVGAFVDTTIYGDVELTVELCALTAGTAWPSSSYGLALENDVFDDPAIYSVSSDGLDAHCDGASAGFVSVPSATVLGATRTIVPLQRFIGPS